MLDGIDLEETKRYMYHYNFPAYMGEATPSSPGRNRHGVLAEKALNCIPNEEEFPYAIRLCLRFLCQWFNISGKCMCQHFSFNGRWSSHKKT